MPLLVKILCLLLLVLLSPAPAFGNGAQLIYGDSPLYLWTKYDLIQKGQSPPTNNFALAQEEFYSTFLDEGLPQKTGSRQELIFSFSPSLTYLDYPANPGGVEEKVPYRLTYLHGDLPPLLELGTAFSLENWLYGKLVIDSSVGLRQLVDEPRDNWVNNLQTKTHYMEFPREGYLSLSQPNAYLALGRFRNGIGHGYFGNTFLNSKAPFYDQIQATYYDHGFKFFYLLGSSSAILSREEQDIQEDRSLDIGGQGFTDPMKTFAYHRLEVQPTEWITLGIGEMNIIGGKFPDFSHINPFGFWHNTYTFRCSNVMMMVDASVVPLKGLHLYGEFTVDDKRLGGGDPKPTAYAEQVGAAWVLPFSAETKHVIGAEFAHVDTYTYNRWQPYLTMYQRYPNTPRLYSDIPLGYPFGGDLNHYGIYYRSISRRGLERKLSLHRLEKGEVELGLDENGVPYYPLDLADDARYLGPSGIAEEWTTLEFSSTIPVKGKLSLDLAFSQSWINNYNHVPEKKSSCIVYSAGIKWDF